MTTYMEPVIAEINTIYFFVNYIYHFNIFTGFSVKTPDGGNHTVKERLLMCSVDIPARALVLNIIVTSCHTIHQNIVLGYCTHYWFCTEYSQIHASPTIAFW